MTLSDYLTATKLRTPRIKSIKDETPTVKSITFTDERAAYGQPGQFVMIWIPGVDEVPMSLSVTNAKQNLAGITVERVGEATKRLHELRDGDVIGLRGPFGNGYSVTKARNVMIVGGGTGMASLAPLVEKLKAEANAKITLLLGAKTRSELIFLDRIKGLSDRTILTTEDGGYGEKGLVTEASERLLANEKFDVVYACGPEKMMLKLFDLTEKRRVTLQVSLERLMRCAIGICGTCVIGKYRVCRDGPVLSGDQLSEVAHEFGHFRLGFDGRKTSL